MGIGLKSSQMGLIELWGLVFGRIHSPKSVNKMDPALEKFQELGVTVMHAVVHYLQSLE